MLFMYFDMNGEEYDTGKKDVFQTVLFFGCQLFFEAYFVDQVSSDACLLWTDIFSTCSSFSLSFTLEVPVMPCGLFPFPVLLMHYALYIQPILSIYPESCS